MSLQPNELNYLIYRYFLEQGYEHAAFAFFNELDISMFSPDPQNVPKGLLVALIQKSLQLLDIEMHIDAKGQLHSCTKPLQLFEPHSCYTVHQINQVLERSCPQMFQKQKSTIQNLPQPILLNQQDILQKIYLQPNLLSEVYDDQVKQEEFTDQILQNLHQKSTCEVQQPNITELQSKYDEQNKISALSIDFLLEKINKNIPQIQIDTQCQLSNYQKQLQLQQNQILDEEQLLNTDSQQFIQFNSFIKQTQSPITCIKSSMLEKVLKVTEQNKQHMCTCVNPLCECDLQQKDEDAQDVNSIEQCRIIVYGDQNGQAFVIIFNEQFQFMTENIILQNISQADVVSVHLMQNRNRFIISQSDGTVNFFKLNIQFNRDQINPEILQIHSNKPFGQMILTKTILIENRLNQTYLLSYGSTSSICVLYLNNMQQQRLNDTLSAITSTDGIEQLLFTHNDQTLDLFSATITCSASIGDIVISGRSDKIIMVSAINKETVKVQLQHNPLIIVPFNGNVYIFSDSLESYEFNIQTNKITIFSVDAPVVSAIALPQGVAYLSGNHVFLLGGVENGFPLIKLDWILPEEGNFIVQEDDFINVISKGQIYQIDSKGDDFSTKQIFKLGEIQAFDFSKDCTVYGSVSGCINIFLRWSTK